jgi:hypothetical protein
MKTPLMVLLLLGLFSCASPNEKEVKEMNYLVFEFHDSSVPPPYHRSYELRFEGSTVHVIVDSYGDILTDEVVELGEEKVKEAFELVKKHQVVNKEKTSEDEGCTGGTGVSVAYGLNDEVHCDGYVYFCGGGEFGDLSGDLAGLKSDLRSLIPEFSSFLKED